MFAFKSLWILLGAIQLAYFIQQGTTQELAEFEDWLPQLDNKKEIEIDFSNEIYNTTDGNSTDDNGNTTQSQTVSTLDGGNSGKTAGTGSTQTTITNLPRTTPSVTPEQNNDVYDVKFRLQLASSQPWNEIRRSQLKQWVNNKVETALNDSNTANISTEVVTSDSNIYQDIYNDPTTTTEAGTTPSPRRYIVTAITTVILYERSRNDAQFDEQVAALKQTLQDNVGSEFGGGVEFLSFEVEADSTASTPVQTTTKKTEETKPAGNLDHLLPLWIALGVLGGILILTFLITMILRRRRYNKVENRDHSETLELRRSITRDH